MKTSSQKIDHLTPDFSQVQTPPDPTIGAISLICFSCYQSRHRQNLISVFSASHKRRTRTVKRDGHKLLY
jgi:hypothetical protein